MVSRIAHEPVEYLKEGTSWPIGIQKAWTYAALASKSVSGFQLNETSRRCIELFDRSVIKYVKREHPRLFTPIELLPSFLKQLMFAIPMQRKVKIEIAKDQLWEFQIESIPCCIKNGVISILNPTLASSATERVLVNGVALSHENVPLQPGDTVCKQIEDEDPIYCFTVTEAGSFCISDDNCVLHLSPEALQHSQNQYRSIHFPSTTPEHLRLVTYREPFPKQSLFFPHYVIAPTPEEHQKNLDAIPEIITERFEVSKVVGFQILVDLENDKILQFVIEYFKKEFKHMGYSPLQQAYRLHLFILSSLKFHERIGDINQKANKIYYLGEILRSGQGVCAHFALLFKVLADQLNLPNTMIMNLNHAWNTIKIDDCDYLVDISHNRFLPMDKLSREERAYYLLK